MLDIFVSFSLRTATNIACINAIQYACSQKSNVDSLCVLGYLTIEKCNVDSIEISHYGKTLYYGKTLPK